MRLEVTPRGRSESSSPYGLPTALAPAACALWLTLLLLPLVATAADLERVRAEIAAVRATLDSDGSRLTAARERAFALAREVDEALRRHAELDARAARKNARIAALEVERLALAGALDNARAGLSRSLVVRYALSLQPRLKLLLNQDRARSVSRALAYYDYVAQAHTRDLDALHARLDAHAAILRALGLEHATLRRLRHESAVELERLRVLEDQHAVLLAAIEARMEDRGTRLAQLEQDEAKLLALVESLGRTTPSGASGAPFGTLAGQLAWPVAGRIAKPPGQAMRDGGARWAGVVIAGAAGQPVRAVAAGEVVYADWFRNLGKLVIIDHGDAFMTLYGNTAEVLTRAGARVAAGDIIATVGDGGGDSAHGLYFELRAAGRPLDPRQWCARRE